MPDKKHKSYSWRTLAIGLLCGVVLYHVVISASGYAVISRTVIDEQQHEVVTLQREIDALWDEFLSQPAVSLIGTSDRPYDEAADARADVDRARAKARSDSEYLMVTFGANWCVDCRTLYRNLKSPEVTSYTQGLFSFTNVNVGKFNRNNDLAAELGATLERGIPVAIFYGPDGQLIGTTNEGQLEPARRYSSKQILMFLEDVAERSRFIAPDAARKTNK